MFPLYSCICQLTLVSLSFYQNPSLHISLSQYLYFFKHNLQMETTNSEMPCKIRKRRLPTASSSSFAHNCLAQLFMDNTDSPPHNEKCANKSNCKEDEPAVRLPKSGTENEMVEKSVPNVERSQNKSCSPPEVRFGLYVKSSDICLVNC